MALRINHNQDAQNTLRNLVTAQNSFSTSMARLSSGKRINSAADDAAGYAISNKLMAQSTGLSQAQSNAQDGISLVQTATGGLQSTQGLLQRMRQLAVQSANDTNTASDRQAIQGEADQISSEITQIGNTTQFNTKNLLDGTLGSTGTTTGTSTIGGLSSGAAVTNAGTLGAGLYTLNITAVGTAGATAGAGVVATGGTTIAGTSIGNAANGLVTNTAAPLVGGVAAGSYNLTVGGSLGSTTIAVTAGPLATGDSFQNVIDKINAFTTKTGVTAAFTASGITLTNSVAGSNQTVTATGTDNLMKGLGLKAAAAGAASLSSNSTVSASGSDGAANLVPVSPSGSTITLAAAGNVFTDNTSGFKEDLSGDASVSTGAENINVVSGAATLQVGANTGSVNTLSVSIGDMRAKALGVQGASATQALDISSSASVANAALATIDSAIATTNTQSVSLGSVQNRLTTAISNLSIGEQNMTAAYSSITDVNMAQESTNLATAQILQQASTAMLAQANQAPQGVLKLLG